MAGTRQSFSAEIDGTPEDCFAVLVDFADYPNWSSVITSASVLEHHPDGLPKRVEFTLDMMVRSVRYVLDYTYEPPARSDWKLVEGDVDDVVGAYRFEKTGTGTRATCEQAVSLGFWVPGPILRLAEQKALEDSVLQFKAAVQKRRVQA